VARIAARQHGVISVRQLHAAGLDSAAIARRVTRGLLHRIHRGVYAVGHRGLTARGRWKAATLACGEGAVLSHRSAAELWGMLGETRSDCHVTVPVAGGRAKRRGIVIHRRPHMLPSEITSRDGIPVTSPQRTLLDLRTRLDPEILRRAIREAEFRGLPVDATALVGDRTASPLELEFLRLCRRHHLPEPEANVRIGPYVVDFLWRAERVVVETDGRQAHRGVVAADEDRERDRYLRRLGYTVLRFTYAEVVGRPKRVAAAVRATLKRRMTS